MSTRYNIVYSPEGSATLVPVVTSDGGGDTTALENQVNAMSITLAEKKGRLAGGYYETSDDGVTPSELNAFVRGDATNGNFSIILDKNADATAAGDLYFSAIKLDATANTITLKVKEYDDSLTTVAVLALQKETVELVYVRSVGGWFTIGELGAGSSAATAMPMEEYGSYTFEPSAISNYNPAVTGSAGYGAGMNPYLRTLGTPNSHALIQASLPNNPLTFAANLIWDKNIFAKATVLYTAVSTDGTTVWGVGGGALTNTGFTPYRFIGFVIDRTGGVDTVTAVTGDGTDSSSVVVDTSSTGMFTMAVKKTSGSVLFYLDGVQVAEIVDIIPNDGAFQSNWLYCGVGNKDTGENHSISLTGHTMSHFI